MRSDAVIHVVDDDLAVRQSMAFLLSANGFAVRVHDGAASFLADVDDPGSGCVITDIQMPGVDGLEFIAQLRARGYAIAVIVMTGHADVPLAVEAMKRGAADFIEKPFDDAVLVAAIHAALTRQDEAAREEMDATEIRERIAALSEREHQVLEGLIAGKANKVIGSDLDISPRTVEIYRANVMAKMHAGSLSELIRLTLTAGVVP